MNFQENQLIDQQYVLVKYLGAGSFAEVWSAYRKGEKPAACYALKLFMSKARIDDNIKRDFEEEYAKATSFKSDYILSPIAHGIHGGITPYFVMPLCRGSLMDEFKNRKANNTGYERNTRGLFHANELISLFNNIAAALDATYKKEVIHLDIKPQNILIYEDKIEDESIGHIKYMLTDFVISKHIG